MNLVSLERWAYLSGAAGLILTALAAILGIVSWLLTNHANDIKQGNLLRFQSESTTRVAEAELRTAEARKLAADANQKAAEANQKAEEERLARVRIEERLAPRHFSEAERQALAKLLAPFKGKKLEIKVYADPETQRFAREVIPAFRDAGVIVEENMYLQSGQVEPGFVLLVGSGTTEFAEQLSKVLVTVGLARAPMSGHASEKVGELALQIGPKG